MCSLYLLTIEQTSEKSHFHMQLSSLLPLLNSLTCGPTTLSLPSLLLLVVGAGTQEGTIMF
jgi:hypothetical protein